MSKPQFARECIEQAIRAFSAMHPDSPALVRQIVRRETERMLDRTFGTDHGGSRGGFRAYLKHQSDSQLWDSEGDEAHDGTYYRTGAASCFFPVAARELVKDGLDAQHIAQFCMEAAAVVLQSGGASLKDTEQKVLDLVLAMRVSDEDRNKAA